MALFKSTFDEADMSTDYELVDKQTADLQKKSNPKSKQILNDAIDLAMKGDLSDLKKIRAGQAISPYEKGVTHHDEYFQYGNDKILVRYYYPEKCTKPSDLPIFIFIHGGGWCHSSVEQRNYMLSRLSLLSNIIVASINYTLSPDVKYGRSIDECYQIYADIVNKSSSTRLIFISGDSSGGNLAAALIHKIKSTDQNLRLPNALLLFYPVIDLYNDYPSHHIYENGFGLELDHLKKCIDAYVPDVEMRKDPLYSPNFGDLRYFPPSLVITSQFDVLRSEGLAFAKKLDESGVPVRYICMKSAEHGFFATAGIHIEKLTNIGLAYIEEFLKIFIK
ncbi:hypothetical protein M9Y10_032270 [Tritrichomonas musculus]|uniref:Alpha/beta hydrolase fold-3 domain-containing protein n=1 Tax=Tritrichomonas musculus TaxID=1915356 RepID=A0ABR2GZJ8_9EUKA